MSPEKRKPAIGHNRRRAGNKTGVNASSDNIITHFDNGCQVRTYPDLSAFCLREGLDLSLRLWYLLRQHCPDGRGWVTLDDVYHLSCGNRRQTRAWLRQGEGTFWTRSGKTYYLAGLEKLSVALGVVPYKNPVYIALADIENLARFRAALFASWFADKARTISQARLSEIFGRTDRTLRTWAKLAGLNVSHNLAWAQLPDAGDDLSKYPPGTLEALTGGAVKTWCDDPDDKPNNVWLEYWSALPGEKGWNNQNYQRGRTPVLVWRMPNTYRSELERGPKTRLQRSAVQALSSVGSTLRANAHLFFERGPGQSGAAARALQREPHVCFAEEGAGHYGYGLWSFNAV